MKTIPNEPENLRKGREKQVMDNLRTEIELLRLRQENQEEKYEAIDNKMKEEIIKIAVGQRRNFLNYGKKTVREMKKYRRKNGTGQMQRGL